LKWYVSLHAHVGMSMEVEADDWREAQQKAQEIASKRRTPRPNHWTPTATSRIVERRAR
jgi:hypothetical protein